MNRDVLAKIFAYILHRDLMSVCKNWHNIISDMCTRASEQRLSLTMPTIIFAEMTLHDRIHFPNSIIQLTQANTVPLSSLKLKYRIPWEEVVDHEPRHLRTSFNINSYFMNAFVNYEQFRLYIHNKFLHIEPFWYSEIISNPKNNRMQHILGKRRRMWKCIQYNPVLYDKLLLDYVSLRNKYESTHTQTPSSKLCNSVNFSTQEKSHMQEDEMSRD